jgi:hypothetical protein
MLSREAWTLGMRWKDRDCDGMHFQAAFVSKASLSAIIKRGGTEPLVAACCS